MCEVDVEVWSERRKEDTILRFRSSSLQPPKPGEPISLTWSETTRVIIIIMIG